VKIRQKKRRKKHYLLSAYWMTLECHPWQLCY
jgi:hypothetical protein